MRQNEDVDGIQDRATGSVLESFAIVTVDPNEFWLCKQFRNSLEPAR